MEERSDNFGQVLLQEPISAECEVVDWDDLHDNTPSKTRLDRLPSAGSRAEKINPLSRSRVQRFKGVLFSLRSKDGILVEDYTNSIISGRIHFNSQLSVARTGCRHPGNGIAIVLLLLQFKRLPKCLRITIMTLKERSTPSSSSPSLLSSPYRFPTLCSSPAKV